MKAKYKIGMLLSYKTETGEVEYGAVKAVVNHADHADYLLENGDHVAESMVVQAYAPVGGKKLAKKRAPRKAKTEAAVEAE